MTLERTDPPTITVRPMTVDDVTAAAAIEAESSPSPWSADLFAGEFTVPEQSRAWLVAVDSSGSTRALTEVVVGFCGLLFVPGPDPSGPPVEAHVMNIAVAPARRRAGIARRLLTEALRLAAGRGADTVTLEVRASNDAARALYEATGFRDVGARPGYYPDGEDARILWLDGLGGLQP